MFPIKYIDNNLVFNRSGECFAYYELVPYNYSFLSIQEKEAVQKRFRRLISQVRDGRIHALEIATESEIEDIQENSKELIEGALKDIAEDNINADTAYICDRRGKTQVNYRFFIGFKLIKEDSEFSVSLVRNSVMTAFKDFLYSVNRTFMGDYVDMSDEEIRRYSQVGNLVTKNAQRYFKLRKLDKNDFGYIIEHNNGLEGIAYEKYEYQLPKFRSEGKHLIKWYDLLKLTKVEKVEHGKYLEIIGENFTKYVSYFVINEVIGSLEEFSSEIFYYQQADFPYSIDTSMHIDIVPNKKAIARVRNKGKELKDLDNHAYQSNNETSAHILDALEDAEELEYELSKTKNSMYKLNYVIRVSANTKEELKLRCEEVRDYYDNFNIKIIRPSGNQLDLHGEFIPSSKRSIDDYIQEVTADFIAILGFGSSRLIGEERGILLGWNVDTGKIVYNQPWLAAQGVVGSVTNALSVVWLGALGGGKSQSFNKLTCRSVEFGSKVLILDPKGERKSWKKTLPRLAPYINNVNLTNRDEDRGRLDPFVIMKSLKDAKALAFNVLTFLTGIKNKDGKQVAAINKAIDLVAKREKKGLYFVIEELQNMKTEVAMDIADHLKALSECDFASLLFSRGDVVKTIDLDNQLNIISVENLLLPENEKVLDDYTMEEMMSVAMMIVISTFALDFIHSDRETYKIVGLDEAWAFLQVAQGKALANKLVRAGRSMNAGVHFITQGVNDIDVESRNRIGMKFAFRSTDITEIKATLEFYGLDPEDESNQDCLRDLRNGECLYQDIRGHVAVIYIYCNEEEMRAFDTRPPMKRKE